MALTLVLKKGFTPRNIYVKYESAITYHSIAMVNVRNFAEKQTDKRMDQKLHAPPPPDQSMRGHKNRTGRNSKLMQTINHKHVLFDL